MYICEGGVFPPPVLSLSISNQPLLHFPARIQSRSASIFHHGAPLHLGRCVAIAGAIEDPNGLDREALVHVVAGNDAPVAPGHLGRYRGVNGLGRAPVGRKRILARAALGLEDADRSVDPLAESEGVVLRETDVHPSRPAAPVGVIKGDIDLGLGHADQKGGSGGEKGGDMHSDERSTGFVSNLVCSHRVSEREARNNDAGGGKKWLTAETIGVYFLHFVAR